MKILLSVVIFYMFVMGCESVLNSSSYECPNVRNSLSSIRKRRHLTFPDGSNAILTISLVKAFMTHAPSGWNIALEIEVTYPLPDAEFTNKHSRRKLHHRQRRKLWETLQRAIDIHNLNGQMCIMRSICEAQKWLAPPGKSLVHDLLRSVFVIPTDDEELAEELGSVFPDIKEGNFCEKNYDCPFSILNIIFDLNHQNYY